MKFLPTGLHHLASISGKVLVRMHHSLISPILIASLGDTIAGIYPTRFCTLLIGDCTEARGSDRYHLSFSLISFQIRRQRRRPEKQSSTNSPSRSTFRIHRLSFTQHALTSPLHSYAAVKAIWGSTTSRSYPSSLPSSCPLTSLLHSRHLSWKQII